jgi:hypothetical protein
VSTDNLSTAAEPSQPSRLLILQQPTAEYGLLECALTYARNGRSILPLRQRDKVPRVKDWLNAATTDIVQIAQWWTETRWANIGMLTGIRNRLLVVDPDTHHGDGNAELAAWCESARVDLSAVPYVDTPSGGRHYYFRLNEPFPGGKLSPNVDVLGDGRQVAVPPSCRPLAAVAVSHRAPGDPPVRAYEMQALGYYVGHGDLLNPPPVPEAILRGTKEYVRPGRGGESEDGPPLPATEWYLENGFPMGRRDDDCLGISRRLWNQFGNEAVVRKVIAAVCQRTPMDESFNQADVNRCIAQAKKYWEESYAHDLHVAQGILRRRT